MQNQRIDIGEELLRIDDVVHLIGGIGKSTWRWRLNILEALGH